MCNCAWPVPICSAIRNLMEESSKNASEKWIQDIESNFAKQKQVQQQLVTLLHAEKCLKHDQNAEATRPDCTISNCSRAKEVIRHMDVCISGLDCAFPDCIWSRQLITHWKECERVDCPICGLIKTIQNSLISVDLREISSTVRTDSTLDRFSEDIRKTLPEPEVPPVIKPFQKHISKELRNRLIMKIVRTFLPTYAYTDLRGQKAQHLISYARTMEKEILETSNDREGYFHSIAEEIYKIQKEGQDMLLERLCQRTGDAALHPTAASLSAGRTFSSYNIPDYLRPQMQATLQNLRRACGPVERDKIFSDLKKAPDVFAAFLKMRGPIGESTQSAVRRSLMDDQGQAMNPPPNVHCGPQQGEYMSAPVETVPNIPNRMRPLLRVLLEQLRNGCGHQEREEIFSNLRKMPSLLEAFLQPTGPTEEKEEVGEGITIAVKLPSGKFEDFRFSVLHDKSKQPKCLQRIFIRFGQRDQDVRRVELHHKNYQKIILSRERDMPKFSEFSTWILNTLKRALDVQSLTCLTDRYTGCPTILEVVLDDEPPFYLVLADCEQEYVNFSYMFHVFKEALSSVVKIERDQAEKKLAEKDGTISEMAVRMAEWEVKSKEQNDMAKRQAAAWTQRLEAAKAVIDSKNQELEAVRDKNCGLHNEVNLWEAKCSSLEREANGFTAGFHSFGCCGSSKMKPTSGSMVPGQIPWQRISRTPEGPGQSHSSEKMLEFEEEERTAKSDQKDELIRILTKSILRMQKNSGVEESSAVDADWSEEPGKSHELLLDAISGIQEIRENFWKKNRELEELKKDRETLKAQKSSLEAEVVRQQEEAEALMKACHNQKKVLASEERFGVTDRSSTNKPIEGYPEVVVGESGDDDWEMVQHDRPGT